MHKLHGKRILILVLLASTALLSSCLNNGTDPTLNRYNGGVWVVNEGIFGTDNTADLSYWIPGQSVENNIFSSTNGRDLGDVLQSASIGTGGALFNGSFYLVVNNSNKVEIINPQTAREQATVSGFSLPRYLTQVQDEKLYVSEWVNFGQQGRISVVDLNTNTRTDSIALNGEYPERILLIDNILYVAAAGFSTTTRLHRININTDDTLTSIALPGVPVGLAQDADGDLWVQTIGDDYLVEILPATGEITEQIPLTITDPRAGGFSNANGNLTTNGGGNVLYFQYNWGVYRFAPATDDAPVEIIDRNFYGFGVQPSTGMLFAAEALNFTSEGRAIRFDATAFTPIDSVNVGLTPNGFVFTN